MKTVTLLALTTLIGCAYGDLIIPITGPITAVNDDGQAVQHCQVVIADGELTNRCTKVHL